MTITKRNDWQNLPLPETTKDLSYQRAFTTEEMEQIKLGLLPKQMEDKWFVYLEDDNLNFHRIWTGHQIFQLTIVPADNRYTVKRTIVNREPSQYNQKDDNYDIKLLDFLIDRLLLSKRVPFPINETIEQDKQPLFRHSVVGYGRSNKEE